MKLLLLIMAMVLASGCATAARLNKLSVGMSEGDVIDKMGEPDYISAGNYGYLYQYALHPSATDMLTEHYGVVVRDGKVVAYGHIDQLFPPTPEERSARRVAAMQMFQAMQSKPQPAFTPMQPYQVKTPQQTRCTTNTVAGTAYTNCSSQ